MLKKLLRKILGCRKDETIRDCTFRHKINFQKIFYRKTIEIKDFEKQLRKSGIKEGDNIMLHSAWRAFFNYIGKPEDVIDTILEIIGKQGTLIMPCYGKNKKNFDVDNDPSAAGVISEAFRKYKGVYRSHGSHFACAALGPKAKYLTEEHKFSKYGFDKYSPYSKFVDLENSKIVMLGLGKNSVKLSLYHLPEMLLKDTDKFYGSLFKRTYTSFVYHKEKDKIIKEEHKNMIMREDTIPNKKNIKKIYKQDFTIRKKISNIDIVVINAKKALKYILTESSNKRYMIRKKII